MTAGDDGIADGDDGDGKIADAGDCVMAEAGEDLLGETGEGGGEAAKCSCNASEVKASSLFRPLNAGWNSAEGNELFLSGRISSDINNEARTAIITAKVRNDFISTPHPSMLSSHPFQSRGPV